ncbi:MAG: bifunctional phosphoribosylaminoimidazolecarboxamide formyltransferase/IMP cyclohydrolase, partial [Actinomycetota bacterium]|nr:bifunctional phosphoribosylaminoimidazolecarboxamide formyltransferase/IMP cyclohydrolase [Actinomycetota bacterium]
MTQIHISRALISVYDKTGIDELARGLHAAGVEIVSTGSTAARIRDLGIPVTPVDEVTGFPEILGGRVKTLHPHVHAGLLADQNDPEHVETISALGIEPFQLLVANLYPFRETVAAGASAPEVVEQIDIGGPAMVRASAKNHGSIAVVVDPARYGDVLAAVADGGFDLAARQRLALAAFRHTAAYDIAVASWLGSFVAPDDEVDGTSSGFPGWIAASYERAAVLRYGENPHQRAALYVSPDRPGGVAHAEQVSGKEMSYNNYVDADAAWRAAYDFSDPCVAIIKHANPCGIAVGTDIAEAHRKAHACDPVSAYGGVIATNAPVTAAMADQLADIFTEAVVAPAFDDAALALLTKKKSLRLLVAEPRPSQPTVETRSISGGTLLQTADRIDAPGDDPSTWTLATGEPADNATMADLVFAWRALRAVKSNAILLACDGATVGVGMGQVNRVDSCRLAVERAGDRASGAVAASDAFFPFADGLQVLLDAGVRAVV